MYQSEKITNAIALLTTHNQQLGDAPGKIDLDKFPKALAGYGISSDTCDEDLKTLSWEDINKIIAVCWIERPLIEPKILCQKLANIFREKPSEPQPEDKKQPVTWKKAEKMSTKQLVECFDAEEPTSAVAIRLQSISKGEPFVVFSSGRIVDVDTTFKLLMEVKQGYQGLKSIDVNGAIKPVYKVGEIPDCYAEENPLWVGRPLRPDCTCDQTGRSWAGVELPIRQFVRLALIKGFIKNGIDSAHDVLDRILQPDALMKLRKRYPDVSLAFDELEKTSQLPRLQVPLKTQKQAIQGGGNSPFSGGKVVEWIAPSNPLANFYTASSTAARSYSTQYASSSNCSSKAANQNCCKICGESLHTTEQHKLIL